MDKLTDLPIDWANVNWPYVIVLALIVFICTFIGTLYPSGAYFRRRLDGALVRRGICILDLLSTRTASADTGGSILPPAPPATTSTTIKPVTQ
jgi:hypothetical protein